MFPTFIENRDSTGTLTMDQLLESLRETWQKASDFQPNTIYMRKDVAEMIMLAAEFWRSVDCIFGTKRPISRDKWNKVRWPKKYGNTSWDYRFGESH